jgi:hypothetical protein
MWQTAYLLNWEVPGAGSLDPLDAWFRGLFVEGGGLVRACAGPVAIQSSLTIPLGLTMLTVIGEDFAEDGKAIYVAASLSVEAYLAVGDVFLVSAGYAVTRPAFPTGRYAVEEGLTIKGSMSHAMEEIRLGIGAAF